MSTLMKFFCMFKSFKTLYLIQYHKNAFYDKFFLSVYSTLQFPGLVKNHSQISALGCLERAANKKRRVPR